MPSLDVPVATYPATSYGLVGLIVPVKLSQLYPTHDGYVTKMQEATDRPVAASFLLPHDAEKPLTPVRASSVGGRDKTVPGHPPRADDGRRELGQMPDRVKFALNAALALATLFLTSVLWHYPVALIALLLVTALGIYAIRPNATSIVVYLTGFVFGPLAEAVSISTGAWEYDTTHLLGVPVWLPFVWGNAALFIQNMAELWKSLLTPQSSRRRIADQRSVGDSPEAPIPAGDGNGASARSQEAESTARR